MRGLSPITQNVLLLRHVEVNARLYRMLTVLKVRDSDHDTRLREFRITSHGIELGDTFDDTSNALAGTARQGLPGRAAPKRAAKSPPSRKRTSPSRPRTRARKK